MTLEPETEQHQAPKQSRRNRIKDGFYYDVLLGRKWAVWDQATSHKSKKTSLVGNRSSKSRSLERGPGDSPDVHPSTKNDPVVFWQARNFRKYIWLWLNPQLLHSQDQQINLSETNSKPFHKAFCVASIQREMHHFNVLNHLIVRRLWSIQSTSH